MAIHQYRQYFHSSKDENSEIAADLDMDLVAYEKFLYANYEVRLDMEVNTDTGEARIVGVDGLNFALVEREAVIDYLTGDGLRRRLEDQVADLRESRHHA